MRRGALVPALLVLAALPGAAAQGYVAGCSQECRPGDVNPEGPATGHEPLRVILYAHRPTEEAFPLRVLLALATPGAHEGAPTAPAPTPLASLAGQGVGEAARFDLIALGPTVDPTGAFRGAWQPPPGASAPPLRLAPGPIVLYFYVSADAAAPEANMKTGVLPQLRLEARMQPGMEYEEAAEPMAHGVSEPVLLASRPGAPNVYEFRVEMEPRATVIEGFDGLVLRADLHQVKEDGAVEARQSGWYVHWGPTWLPRLVVPVVAPLATHQLATSVPDRKDILVRWTLASVFGVGDIDTDRLDVRLVGGDGVRLPTEPTLLAVRAHPTPEEAPYRLEATWRVPVNDLRGAPAPLTVQVSVENAQGTYRLEAVRELPFAELQGGVGAPVAGAAWVLLALCAAASASVAARRRPGA